MELKKWQKVAGAVVTGAALLGAGVAGGYTLDQPVEVDVDGLKAAAFDEGKSSVDVDTIFAEGAASVEPEIITETTEVEVEVDNENLDLVLEEIYDNEGDVSYLTDDLDDDEVDKIVDRIVFAQEVKELALKEVEDELADELDNEEITLEDDSEYEFDEDDFEKIRLDDNADEIEIRNVDYDDRDADVVVTGRFRHNDDWFTFEAEVGFEDGNVEDFKVYNIQED